MVGIYLKSWIKSSKSRQRRVSEIKPRGTSTFRLQEEQPGREQPMRWRIGCNSSSDLILSLFYAMGRPKKKKKKKKEKKKKIICSNWALIFPLQARVSSRFTTSSNQSHHLSTSYLNPNWKVIFFPHFPSSLASHVHFTHSFKKCFFIECMVYARHSFRPWGYHWLKWEYLLTFLAGEIML